MEKKIKNILIPMNFSNSCDQAVKTGIAMCKRHGAVLHLLEIKRPQRFVYPTGKSAELIGMRLESLMDDLKFMELYAAEISSENNIDCFYHIEEGAFAKTIATVAGDFYCDLIILQQEHDDSLYGSFKHISATEVIKETECPVMTLPRNNFSKDFKSISFPVWATKSVFGKLEMSLSIIKKNDSKVMLLGALKTKDDAWELNMVDKLASSLLALISLTTNNVEKELDHSSGTAKRILKRASKNGSDLLVISSSLNRGIKSVFVPSYTEQIIRNSTIPVLSVK